MKKLIFILLFITECVEMKAQKLSIAQIGYTFYDLQRNAAVGRRLINYPDGKKTATWTIKEHSNSNREIGYSHYHDNTWTTRSIPSGGTNTGWPAICTNGSNQELIFSHQFTGTFTSILYKNTGPGKTDFIESQPISNNTTASTGGTNAGWHKTVSSGDNVYLVAYSLNNAPNNGVSNPLYFSRSTDGGSTFSNFNLLPNSDSVNYPSGLTNADSYSIDAFDKYVVIATSSLYSDLTIWKSEDFGANFTRKVVERFPIQGWDKTNFKHSDVDGDGMADTLSATTQQIDVLLDKNGKAHLFWGRVFYYQDSDTGFATVQSIYSNKANKQIIYWNEIDNTIKEIAGSPDINGNGKIDNSSLKNNAFSYRNIGYAGQVTTGIDGNGNFYLAYAGYVEGDTAKTEPKKGQQFHNLFVTKSVDMAKHGLYPLT